MPKIRDFQPYLLEALKDEEGSLIFLKSAFESKDPEVIVNALNNIRTVYANKLDSEHPDKQDIWKIEAERGLIFHQTKYEIDYDIDLFIESSIKPKNYFDHEVSEYDIENALISLMLVIAEIMPFLKDEPKFVSLVKMFEGINKYICKDYVKVRNEN